MGSRTWIATHPPEMIEGSLAKVGEMSLSFLLGPINSGTPAFPLATSAIAPLRAKAESQGSGDFTSLWSGQNATGCKEVPAAQLTRELAAGL